MRGYIFIPFAVFCASV